MYSIGNRKHLNSKLQNLSLIYCFVEQHFYETSAQGQFPNQSEYNNEEMAIPCLTHSPNSIEMSLNSVSDWPRSLAIVPLRS